MKSSYKILLGGLALFGIITLATSSLHYDADGADEYGFPFNFYTKVSGYSLITKQGNTSTDFSPLALIGDIALAFLTSWLILKLTNKFNAKKIRSK
ncbi:hypothetical protein [Pedobacter xixiisoli]|uniref:Uncharacterized protein n=1 Tax=Pedobacter xixiisoli TaxID=1476464 RepID=A0A286AEY9_9SPHI|nr:hypothetical protein [Pedobacter xixiisoli]SOD20474.1 hypothetical protein SAMN06297358_4197 [Pedobacter xixiisoli]